MLILRLELRSTWFALTKLLRSIVLTVLAACQLAIAICQAFVTVWQTIFSTCRHVTDGAAARATKGPTLELFDARGSRPVVER